MQTFIGFGNYCAASNDVYYRDLERTIVVDVVRKLVDSD
jgi:hypothetical protein